MTSLSAMAQVFVPSISLQMKCNHDVQQELVRVQRRSEYIEGKKNRLREKLVDADKVVQDLREKVKSLEEENSKGKDRIVELVKKCDDLSDENRSIKDENRTIKFKQGVEMSETKRKYEERLRSCINMNDTLIREGKRMDETIMKQKREIEDLKMRCCDEKWMGYTLRLNWIIQEGAKVGAIRLPDHEWMTDMAHDMEFPDSESSSVYMEIPSNIRRRYLPNYDDAHMEFTDEDQENQLLDRLTEEASDFSNGIPGPLNQLLDDDPENALDKIRLIQSFARKYISRNEPSGVEVYSAVTIQRIFRGFLSRRIRYYQPVVGFLKDDTQMEEFQEGYYNTPGMRKPNDRPCQVSITFFNTGSDLYAYNWINKNRCVQGRETRVRPFTSAGVRCSTFASHWFEVTNESRGWKKLIRIPMYQKIMNGRLYPQHYYFDVHTGITVNVEQFNCIVPHFIQRRREGIGVPVTIRGRNIIMGYNIIDRDRDNEDDYIQDLTQIAIQLSLEDNIVDDDYGDSLIDMFK